MQNEQVEGNELTHVNASNAIERRFIYVPGRTGPIVWYEGSGTANRRYHHGDERGSTIVMTTQAGTLVAAPTGYDEYGRNSGPTPFFTYTGQESTSFALNFKARFYSATLGRFLSPDPIRYGDGMNMYGYVGGDPVNFVDPTGLCGGPDSTTPTYPGEDCEPGIVTGKRPKKKKEEDDAPVVQVAPEPGRFIEASTLRRPQAPRRPQRTSAQCMLSAVNNNKLSLALDAGAAALTILAPEASIAASIAGSALGLVGIGNALANKDLTAGGIAYAGKQAATAGGIVQAGSSAARLVGRLNVGALGASIVYDSTLVALDYKKCMAGN